MSESQGLLRFAKMTGKVAAPDNDAAKSFRPPQNGALRNRRNKAQSKMDCAGTEEAQIPPSKQRRHRNEHYSRSSQTWLREIEDSRVSSLSPQRVHSTWSPDKTARVSSRDFLPRALKIL